MYNARSLMSGLIALMDSREGYSLAVPCYREPLTANSIVFLFTAEQENPVLGTNIVLTKQDKYLSRSYAKALRDCLWSRNYEMATSETVRIILLLQAKEAWALDIVVILNRQIERCRKNENKQLQGFKR